MTKNIPMRLTLLLGNLLLWIGLDQWSKMIAVEMLKSKFPVHYLAGTFQFMYAENNGAWGNLGGSWPEPYKSLLLIAMPVLVLLAVSSMAVFNKKLKPLEVWSYTFIACGGIGNIIDRIRFGYVVDFMYIDLGGPLHTNIFNVADVVIMIGFGLMIIQLFKDRKLEKNLSEQS